MTTKNEQNYQPRKLRRRLPEDRHLAIMDRFTLSDADPAIQKAFFLTYQKPVGRAALEWLIRELYSPLYTVGEPWEFAIAQAVRIEFAELIKDMIRRGEAAVAGHIPEPGAQPAVQE